MLTKYTCSLQVECIPSKKDLHLNIEPVQASGSDQNVSREPSGGENGKIQWTSKVEILVKELFQRSTATKQSYERVFRFWRIRELEALGISHLHVSRWLDQWQCPSSICDSKLRQTLQLLWIGVSVNKCIFRLRKVTQNYFTDLVEISKWECKKCVVLLFLMAVRLCY